MRSQVGTVTWTAHRVQEQPVFE